MSRLPERPSGASINFAKMHGLGNDYVYVDGSQHPVADAPALARWVSEHLIKRVTTRGVSARAACQEM